MCQSNSPLTEQNHADFFAAAESIDLERHPNSIFPCLAIMYKTSASSEAQTSTGSIGLESRRSIRQGQEIWGSGGGEQESFHSSDHLVLGDCTYSSIRDIIKIRTVPIYDLWAFRCRLLSGLRSWLEFRQSEMQFSCLLKWILFSLRPLLVGCMWNTQSARDDQQIQIVPVAICLVLIFGAHMNIIFIIKVWIIVLIKWWYTST